LTQWRGQCYSRLMTYDCGCAYSCKPFICKDCGFNTLHGDEYYMVTNEAWKASGLTSNGGMLCIGCLETRLGRELTGEDFPDYPINRGVFGMSARIKARIATSNE